MILVSKSSEEFARITFFFFWEGGVGVGREKGGQRSVGGGGGAACKS